LVDGAANVYGTGQRRVRLAAFGRESNARTAGVTTVLLFEGFLQGSNIHNFSKKKLFLLNVEGKNPRPIPAFFTEIGRGFFAL
jgi:hypothetical protein